MKKRFLILSCFSSLCLVLGYLIGHARANGIPTGGALVFSGVLEENNTPVNDPRSFYATVFDAESAGNSVCSTPPTVIQVNNGSFRLPLPSQCEDAVKQNPNLWIQIGVGTDVLPRTKLSAVPYALEAGRAQTLGAVLPSSLGGTGLAAGPTAKSHFLRGSTTAGAWTSGPIQTEDLPIFVSGGNNGSVTCNSWCATGTAMHGTCVGAKDTVTGDYHACDATIPVPAPPAGLLCYCSTF